MELKILSLYTGFTAWHTVELHRLELMSECVVAGPWIWSNRLSYYDPVAALKLIELRTNPAYVSYIAL